MTQTKSEIVINNYFDTDCKDLILSQFIKEAYSRGFKRAVEKMRPCTGYWITDGIVDENGNCNSLPFEPILFEYFTCT